MNLLRRLLYSPFLVQLVVTRRCNLKCGYCNEYDSVSDPVPTELLKARIDKICELGAFSLELTGGEPMLHPQIYDLIAYARARRGLVRVMMISNAFLLNDARIRRLNEAGLQDLQVSVDGVRPNDVTVKVLEPLRPKLDALRRLARFRVVLSGVVGCAPPGEVVEVVAYAAQSGFTPRVLVVHDDKGQVNLSPEDYDAFRQLRRSLGSRFREARDYRDAIMRGERAPFKCRAGSRYIYVDEHGEACWCSQTRDLFSVPIADYTAAELQQQFHTPKACNERCTLGCARTSSRYDQWRPQG